ncbi:FecR family protein [Algibacter miyuki]|uniref:FecR family protein n=1 Tax=Algibacter miyuki TaxID=1306933 RepID=A0ABV5H4B4_9FLAO|nr:FecR domain-containing protein [Algibacter miyuki]MDN3663846.1 DUF4974 domain-containing protein [Algibacter miyuki]
MKNIITKFIANSIAEEELELLYVWLENKDNQNEFERYVLDYHDLNMAMLKNDVSEAYKNVDKSIENKKRSVKIISLFNREYVKYAVAILIIVSSSFFFLSKKTFVDSNNVIIRPGTDKAILTLANGSEIFLDSVTNYQDKMIISAGKEIVYKPSYNKTSPVEYNYLTVPRGGQYHVVLSDGTQVRINSESQLKYPVAFKADETRQVELVYGEAYFDVSPSTSCGGDAFKVFSQSQVIEVLGTQFNIKAYRDETNLYTTLIEGEVLVSTANTDKTLVPNQQSNLDLTTNELLITNVDVKGEIAWVKGEFRLQQKTLKEIMKVLARWYDIEIVFSDKDLEDIRFEGVLSKKQNLVEILNSIKSFGVIRNFKVNDKTITLE